VKVSCLAKSYGTSLAKESGKRNVLTVHQALLLGMRVDEGSAARSVKKRDPG
jgi:hypothetical protein